MRCVKWGGWNRFSGTVSFFVTLMAFVGLLPAFALAEEAEPKESEETPTENPAVRLESTFVGDKEQPAVSYFIPWQGTSTPDKLQWSMEKKHDATLEAVDRQVLERTVNIYQEMQMESGQ